MAINISDLPPPDERHTLSAAALPDWARAKYIPDLPPPDERREISAANLPEWARLKLRNVGQFERKIDPKDAVWSMMLDALNKSEDDARAREHLNRYVAECVATGQDSNELCYELFLDFLLGRESSQGRETIKNLRLAEAALSNVKVLKDVKKLRTLVTYFEQSRRLERAEPFYLALYRAYLTGDGTSRDVEKASQYLSSALESNPEARSNDNRAVPYLHQQIEWCRSAREDVEDLCYQLFASFARAKKIALASEAVSHLEGIRDVGKLESIVKFFELTRQPSKAEPFCLALYRAYLTGDGTSRDVEKASQYLISALESNPDARSNDNRAVPYLHQQIEWCRSAREDVEDLCYQLFASFARAKKIALASEAVSHLEGIRDVGKLESIVKFFELTRQPSKAEPFCITLYQMYLTGDGTGRDIKKAAQYLRSALESNDYVRMIGDESQYLSRQIEWGRSELADVEELCYQLLLLFSRDKKNKLAEAAIRNLDDTRDVTKLETIVKFFELTRQPSKAEEFYIKLYEILLVGDGTRQDTRRAAKYLKSAIAITNTSERRSQLREIYKLQRRIGSDEERECRAYEAVIADGIQHSKLDYAEYLRDHDKRAESVHWFVAEGELEQGYELVDLSAKDELSNALEDFRAAAPESEYTRSLETMRTNFGLLQYILTCTERPKTYWGIAWRYTLFNSWYALYRTIKTSPPAFWAWLIFIAGSAAVVGFVTSVFDAGTGVACVELYIWTFLALNDDVNRRKKYIAACQMLMGLIKHPMLMERLSAFPQLSSDARSAGKWTLVMPVLWNLAIALLGVLFTLHVLSII